MPALQGEQTLLPESDNLRRDFRTAVESNQPNRALYFAVQIIEELDNRVAELESNASSKSASTKPKKSATTKSSSKSDTTTDE